MKDFFTGQDCDVFTTAQGIDHKLATGSISIEKANRLLKERSDVVYLSKNDEHWCHWWQPDDQCKVNEFFYEKRALVVNIEKIEKDTLEKVVKDLVDGWDHPAETKRLSFLVERARKLTSKS